MFDPFPTFDRAFDDVRRAAVGASATGQPYAPALDVRADGEKVVSPCDLPGVRREDLSVTLESGVLTVRGERKYRAGPENERAWLGRSYGAFARSFARPEGLDEQSLSAELALHNAGNIVPPPGVLHGGEAATVEYAVGALGVRDFIACGHTGRGAMQALLGDQAKLAEGMPAVASWLKYAETTRRIMRENYQSLGGGALVNATVEENVLVRLENLRTHPLVAAKIARGEPHLHAWAYQLEAGEVYAFRPEEGERTRLVESKSASNSAGSPSQKSVVTRPI